MEKQKLLMNEGVNSTASAPTWNSCNFGLEILSTELNCGSEQLNTNSFFNPNWETSMDQSDPFESALSSIVSSPAASNASVIPGATGDNVMIRELIGRLGNICNSGEILPQSYIQVQTNNNNSSNTSCYSTPLNSPPKLNLSMTDSQIRGNMPIPGNQLPNHPNLAPLAADPGFAERAARLSCFGSRNFDGLNGLSDIELSQRMIHRSASGKLSRVSSSQSMKAAGSQVNVHQENNNRSRSSLHPQDGNSGSDKKFKSLSRSSTPDNADFGDSKEESSVSEQIPGGDLSSKAQHDANARKRKSVLRAKAKETSSSSPPTKDAKVVGENEESNSKRSKKQDETKGNGNDNDKAKAEEAASAKTVNDGSQKQNKDNSKPPEPPKDYIHVRARRGQATDSHSLAERVRREKISERMKFLQDLVPGCNKVTGKAVMLDEIINYVQSLQRQVEFLSMKLATVNPRMDFNMEALLSKDMFQSRGYMPNSLYPIDSTTQTFPFGYQPQQGLPLTSGITNNAAENQFPINQLNSALRRSPNMQLPSFNGYGEVGYQVPSILEDDLQSLVQMVFDQNQPQSFNDSMATAQMKIEM